MYERHQQSIRAHLQKEDVQERIRRNIDRGRSEATVTIGRAARLFNFTENQLRDWEKRGLLNPPRSKDVAGQRQYTINDLNKLAIIQELIDANYSPGEIPPDIDSIWDSISKEQKYQTLIDLEHKVDHLPINQRIENARSELFWHYYASRALRLSLTLICDELPDTAAGLVLPLQPYAIAPIDSVKDLPKLGPSLVGWLSRTRSSHTLFTPAPWFEYDIDYRLLPLTVMKDDEPQEQQRDRTLIILARRDRRSRALSLNSETVETIRCLLAPLYENAQTMQSYFGHSMRDDLSPAPNLDGTTTADAILDGLTELVIHLGGCNGDGQDSWRFCCILLPKDPSLPLQQHTLVVRTQSQYSPHKVGGTTISPDKSANSLSLRAYQSGHVIYRPLVLDMDTSISHYTVEGPIRSALAMPIGGEDGPVIGVLYIASYEKDAFSESHQRGLRMISRMLEEAMLTYRDRQLVAKRLTNAINRPCSIDPLFEDFFSENDFVCDVEELLSALKTQLGEWEGSRREMVPFEEKKERYREWEATGEVVSFIVVDIDDQSSLAAKYGDQVARNLSQEVGSRIKGQQRLSTNIEHGKVYHMYADRYYLVLKGVTLDEARIKARQLKSILDGDYRIEARRVSAERLKLPESKIELPKVTVRLGVSSYPYKKLKQMLQRRPNNSATSEVRAEIILRLDEMLNQGQREGGNIIISWDVEIWGYKRWPSPQVTQLG